MELRRRRQVRWVLSVVHSLYTGAAEPRAARTKPKVGAADLLRTDLLRTDEGEVGGRAEPSYGVDRPNGRY